MTGTLRFKTLALSALVAAGPLFVGMEASAQNTGVARVGRNNVGVVLHQPRFKVEAVGFLAVDESGRDLPYTSDEVFAVFYNAQNHHLMTETFPDVDSGEDRPFDAEQSCIWPARDPDGRRNGVWECDPAGATGPIRFTIVLFDQDPRWGALTGGTVGGPGGVGFCVGTRNDDLGTCHQTQHNELFRHEFSYEVSTVLARLDPSCRCFTETAAQRGDSIEYQVTFRITRVDNGGEPPALDRNPEGGGVIGPVVHSTGTLTASLNQAFEFDAGAVISGGNDFDFTRSNNAYFLRPGAGARIWVGGATARGYAACAAGAGNHVTATVPVPASGSYACYITSDGRIGELRINALVDPPFGGTPTLALAYTTWQ